MVRDKDKPKPGSKEPLVETASTMSTRANSQSSSGREQDSRMPLGICPSVMERSKEGPEAKKEEEKSKGVKVSGRKTKKKKLEGEKTVVGRQLKKGTKVNAASYKWEVTGLLGIGGFGAVYKVVNQGRVVPKQDEKNTQVSCAMKVEKNSEKDSRLKGEAAVYIMVNNLPEEKKKHFATIYDRGETKSYKFIVIQMLGLSLHDVRKKLGKEFEMATVLNIAKQALEAISSLHGVGCLHRDIKPQNFVVGLETEKSLIFLIDFGIARNMFKKGDHTHLKSQRGTGHFLGTVKFAPLAAHKCVDQSFKDDLEALIYMVFDCLDSKNGLPWAHLAGLGAVRELKEKFMACDLPNWFKEWEKCQFYGQMVPVIGYIGRLSYSSIPDYERVMGEIQAMAANSKVDLNTDCPEWATLSAEKVAEPSKVRNKKTMKKKKKGKKSKEEVKANDDKEKEKVKAKEEKEKEKGEGSKMGKEEKTKNEKEEKTKKNEKGKESAEAVECGST